MYVYGIERFRTFGVEMWLAVLFFFFFFFFLSLAFLLAWLRRVARVDAWMVRLDGWMGWMDGMDGWIRYPFACALKENLQTVSFFLKKNR